MLPLPSPNAISANRRSYRSKRPRPCASCRARKVSCRVAESEVACVSCQKTRRLCSFAGSSPRDTRLRLPREISHERPGTVEEGGHGQSLSAAEDQLPDYLQISNDEEEEFLRDLNDMLLEQAIAPGSTEMKSSIEMDRSGTSTEVASTNQLTWTTPFDHLTMSSGQLGIHESLPYLSTPINHDFEENDEIDTNDPGFDHDVRLTRQGSSHLEGGDESQNIAMESFEDIASSLTKTVQISRNQVPTGVPLGSSTNAKAPVSLDNKKGWHAQLFGQSGESDPFLLRHYAYNQSDEFPFLKLIYRTVGGTSLTGLQNQKPSVPVHFCMTADDIGEKTKEAAMGSTAESNKCSRASLDKIVDAEDGKRLVLLFMEYVFPALPVISRSQFGHLIMQSSSTESNTDLAAPQSPPYLLAAIYAAALQFWAYDDHLCVEKIYQKPSSDDLWKIVFDGITLDMHSPSLATISAALLYINKPRNEFQNVVADTPWVWSFMGSIVALSTSLGLHLECSTWSIPSWEKRLRRRLWWMTYSEEKWRSLLLGRPTLISNDHWLVSELTDHDFDIDDFIEEDDSLRPSNSSLLSFLRSPRRKLEDGLFSQQITQLARFVDDVHTSLYTIKATQNLAYNLDRSIDTVRPLRQRLTLWYTKLPESLQLRKTTNLDTNSNACLHYAYLTLEVLLYRALMRPLGRVGVESSSSPLSHGVEFQGQDVNSRGDSGLNSSIRENYSYQNQLSTFRDQSEAIISAAEKCASLIISVTQDLRPWDFVAFWYTWSRIGFATTSSFVALLLIQSPSKEHALVARGLVESWRQTLKHQSKSFRDMATGIQRLDAMYWSDIFPKQ